MMCDQPLTDLTDELDVFSLNVLHYHDLHLGKEVKSQVTHCIPVIQHVIIATSR